MARTRKAPKRRDWWNRECTRVRRQTVRAHKTRCKHMVRIGRYDDLPTFKGTQGWETW